MKVKILSAVYNLALGGNDTAIDIHQLFLSNRKDIIQGTFSNPKFLSHIGIIEYTRITAMPYVYFVGESIELGRNETEPYLLVKIIDNVIRQLLTMLWFIKDNAVFTTKTY